MRKHKFLKKPVILIRVDTLPIHYVLILGAYFSSFEILFNFHLVRSKNIFRVCAVVLESAFKSPEKHLPTLQQPL